MNEIREEINSLRENKNQTGVNEQKPIEAEKPEAERRPVEAEQAGKKANKANDVKEKLRNNGLVKFYLNNGEPDDSESISDLRRQESEAYHNNTDLADIPIGKFKAVKGSEIPTSRSQSGMIESTASDMYIYPNGTVVVVTPKEKGGTAEFVNGIRIPLVNGSPDKAFVVDAKAVEEASKILGGNLKIKGVAPSEGVVIFSGDNGKMTIQMKRLLGRDDSSYGSIKRNNIILESAAKKGLIDIADVNPGKMNEFLKEREKKLSSSIREFKDKQNAKEAERLAKAKAEQEKAKAELEAENNSYGGFLDGKKPFQQGAVKKALDKRLRNSDGQSKTAKEWIDELSAQGKLKTKIFDGKKKEYWFGNNDEEGYWNAGKTAYEYAKFKESRMGEDKLQFSRTLNRTANPVSDKELNNFLKGQAKQIGKDTGLKFRVVDSVEELNRIVGEKQASDTEGGIKGDTVYLVRGNIDKDRFPLVIAHEVAGHRGVEALFENVEKMNEFFRSLEKASSKDKFIADAFAEVDRLGYEKSERAREAMAKIVERVKAENGTLKGAAKTFVNFITSRVRRFLRDRLGFKNLQLNEAEVYDLAIQALRRTGLKNSNKFFGLDRFLARDDKFRANLTGYDKDGIEVYETSEPTKKLTFKEKKEKAIKMITDTYKGRTAKFTKNGITYYAKLEKDDAQKLVYGDKKSTWSGYNAKINSIADGDVFELVENSKYKNSSNEQGKNKGIHKITDSWDYFDKEVSVDGKYYDVLINVRKNNNGEWVYDVNLTDNVKKNNTNEKGIAPIATKSVQKQAGIRSKASNTLNSNIAQNSNLSNLSNKKFQASRSGVKPEDVAKKTTEEIKDSAYPRKRNFDKAAKPYLKKNLAEFKEIFQNKKSSNYKMAALAVSYLTGYDVAHQNTLERFKRISDFNKLSDNVREYINANITDDAKRAKLLDQLARQKTDKGILDVAAKTHIESERIIRDDLLKELRQNLKDLRPNKISRELSMLKLEALSDTFTQEELDSMLSSNGFSTGAVRKMYGLLRKARASLEVMGDKETGGKLDIPVKITELARELDRKFNESLNPSDGSDVPPSMKVSVEDLAKLNQVLADVKNQSKEAMRNLIHDASNEAYTAQQKIIKEMGPVDEPIANSREEKRIGTYNRYGKPVNSFENLDLDNFSAEMGDTMNKFTHKAILEGQKTVEHYLAKGYGEVDDIIKSFGSDKTEGMSNLEKSFMSVDTTNKHKYDITRDEAMAIYALATDRETKNLINKHGGLTLSLGDKKGSDTFILNADKLKEIESRLTTREKEMVMRGKKLLAQTYLPALNDVYERLNGVPLRLLVDGTYLFSIGQFSDH